MFGMWWGMQSWGLNVPLTSFQLLAGGAGLLICAATLLMVRRKSRVEVESSVVTEELMAYLARIANALEGLKATSSEEITAEVLRRLQEIANSKAIGKVREMPVTLLDR
jgi:hypothetical protein